jgi:hypothetical protein
LAMRGLAASTIDSCINNALYWDLEGTYETSWKSQCPRTAAA